MTVQEVVAVLEDAARICEVEVQRAAEYGGRYGGYGRFMDSKTGPECAADIRAYANKVLSGDA